MWEVNNMDKLSSRLAKRHEISNDYKWNLEEIYQDDTHWNLDMEKIRVLIDEIKTFKGKFSESSDTLLRMS